MFRHSVILNTIGRRFPSNWPSSRRSSTNPTASSDASTSSHDQRKMRGWQIHEYGDVGIIQSNENIKVPIVKETNEVLVKVSAASVNPIDVAMMQGYGSTLLNAFRCTSDIEFPLTLGRDFCGVVVRKGMGVRHHLQVGDHVVGVVPLHRNGSHAEYVCVDASCLTHKPHNLDVNNAASILYAGLTAWSGLFISGGLGGICGALTSHGGGSGKRICILGASGGVGSVAVQIAKAENVEVIASCATNAIPVVESLGTDHIVDYTSSDAMESFASYGPYDIILDCAGHGPDYARQVPWKFDQYITFTTPMLRNFDSFGLGVGLLKNAFNLLENNVQSIVNNRALIKWAYFVPAPHAIEYLKNLAEREKLNPLIDSIFSYDQAVDAYQKVADGHLRGKVIINMEEREAKSAECLDRY